MLAWISTFKEVILLFLGKKVDKSSRQLSLYPHVNQTFEILAFLAFGIKIAV